MLTAREASTVNCGICAMGRRRTPSTPEMLDLGCKQKNDFKERVRPTGHSSSDRSDAGLYSRRRKGAEGYGAGNSASRTGTPDLQQRFVDVRFGVFVHFIERPAPMGNLPLSLCSVYQPSPFCESDSCLGFPRSSSAADSGVTSRCGVASIS